MPRLSRSPTGPAYCLRLSDAAGLPLRDETAWAHSDEHALGMAMRRLSEAPRVEVWRRTRWVGQVERLRAGG